MTRVPTLALLAVLAAGIVTAALAAGGGGLPPEVTAEGAIQLPRDYRGWRLLGTWSVAGEDGAAELHAVYARPETLAAYRRDSRFPDGAVLVKEVRATATADMTTGRVSRAAALKGWFVMVKDDRSRFPGQGLWGDGWGWAWLDAASPAETTTTDYREDCLACHVPARATDWVYVEGYPDLVK